MREYTQKPENKSRTLDSNPRASKQAPISEILQAYRERTLGKPVQRQEIDDDELLQPKLNLAQQEEFDEDELIQPKFDTTQKEGLDDELLQPKFESASAVEQASIQREEKPNNTGLPDNLKTGIENLSGYSMDDVQVHYNSAKPAQLQALAYTQGTDIHVAPGQEQHLPHEAWHVVQQKQGRVQPTMRLQRVNINDNEGLEKEADVMGVKVLGNKTISFQKWPNSIHKSTEKIAQCIVKISGTKMTKELVGEALKYGFRSDEIKFPTLMVGIYQGKDKKFFINTENNNFTDGGNMLANKLYDLYQQEKMTLVLTDITSFYHQVCQDVNLIFGGDDDLVGTPHQFSEFKIDQEKRNPGHIGKKGGIVGNKDMRIYRCMPLEHWENAQLKGHGGSLGQALHYFRLDKSAGKNAVLVEFKLMENQLNKMVGTILSSSEGSRSDVGKNAGKFGRKTENNTEFAETEFFSVDLANAAQIISEKAISKVIAYTGTEPTKDRKKLGTQWTKLT
ncbi:MAG: DUF4157 domain-containing protein [Dysgonamonadaceae bacterium]|jgi:hypothetical protein|nr:DUF4157 domain-containing protein [Dysgonamonadaceae bacterium]